MDFYLKARTSLSTPLGNVIFDKSIRLVYTPAVIHSSSFKNNSKMILSNLNQSHETILAYPYNQGNKMKIVKNECPYKNHTSFQCKYLKNKSYIYFKLICCDTWYCCIYCHMDTSNHKATKSTDKCYCLSCKKESSGYKCSDCATNNSYYINAEQVAKRCRFFKNKGYYIKTLCCYSRICCYRCHNEKIDHKLRLNLEYYCVKCQNQISIGDDSCASCSKNLKNFKYDYQKIARTCPYF